MENSRYLKLNEYLKEVFGERTLKICIDGHFTCPNRDGTLGSSGCIFCSERGSGEHIINSATSISNQVKSYFNSYRSKRANKFIAYFQNFTNTYDTLENLKIKYDSALINNRIVALAIATRPDCINEDVAKLLASYSNKYKVLVELGLQTANPKTGELINRCYSNDDFTNAVSILNKYNIDVVTHIIIGLPNENETDIENTLDFINRHNIQGLKIHSCYVTKGTILGNMYECGDYLPITLEYYLKNVAYILTHISPDVVIHRVSGDAPKDLILAPDWNVHKKWIINGLDKLLKEQDLYQGMYYKESGFAKCTGLLCKPHSLR